LTVSFHTASFTSTVGYSYWEKFRKCQRRVWRVMELTESSYKCLQIQLSSNKVKLHTEFSKRRLARGFKSVAASLPSILVVEKVALSAPKAMFRTKLQQYRKTVSRIFPFHGSYNNSTKAVCHIAIKVSTSTEVYSANFKQNHSRTSRNSDGRSMSRLAVQRFRSKVTRP